MGGLCIAAASGFSVQGAQQIGAGDNKKARLILKHRLLITISFSIFSNDIYKNAFLYFLVYVALPAQQLNVLSSSMLQCSGNMKVTSILNAIMCVLDCYLI